ncbi:MAG TPA: DUF6526 family protein [Gemmatimonadales bacterium]
MSDDSVQNYGNHRRWFPPYHFVVMPILAINGIVALVQFARMPSFATGWGALVAVSLAAGIMLVRWMALRVQDRVIRLEERLRLERLLPGRHDDIESLGRRHLLALRFASDAEVPHLVDRITSGEIGTMDEIKRAIQHWRPDHARC